MTDETGTEEFSALLGNTPESKMSFGPVAGHDHHVNSSPV